MTLNIFVEIMKDVCILSNQMVSLHVVGLLPKVPTESALSVGRDKLASDSSLEERTSLPLDNLIRC